MPIKFSVVCRKCGVILTDRNWYSSSKKKRDYICRDCSLIKGKKYYMEHRDSMLRKQIKRNKERRLEMKIDILSYYSPEIKCVKCGFDDIRALTIDHIHGGGRQHREKVGRGYSFYLWLKKNNYPEGYQVLCMNCQFIKMYERKEW